MQERLGSVRDKNLGLEYGLGIKKGGKFRNQEQTCISLQLNGKSVGYVRFVPSFLNEDYLMTGIFASQRGVNLSAVLLESLSRHAEKENGCFSLVASQRKPLTAFVIQKWGFQPKYVSKKETVYFLGTDDGRLAIAFDNPVKRRQFEQSKLYATGEYKVTELNGEVPIDQVVLNKPYVLVDVKKNQAKRRKTQNRFEFIF